MDVNSRYWAVLDEIETKPMKKKIQPSASHDSSTVSSSLKGKRNRKKDGANPDISHHRRSYDDSSFDPDNPFVDEDSSKV
jgi:hypothetical protein